MKTVDEQMCIRDRCSVKKKGQAYTIKDKLWKEGEIKLIVCPLTDSNGFIMEVSGERLPEEFKLCWAFGEMCIRDRYDITHYVRPGKCTITIRVDNRIKEINVGPDSHSITRCV